MSVMRRDDANRETAGRMESGRTVAGSRRTTTVTTTGNATGEGTMRPTALSATPRTYVSARHALLHER